MHRTLLLLLLLNYFTDMFHICMIQWNNNKYEYESRTLCSVITILGLSSGD